MRRKGYLFAGIAVLIAVVAVVYISGTEKQMNFGAATTPKDAQRESETESVESPGTNSAASHLKRQSPELMKETSKEDASDYPKISEMSDLELTRFYIMSNAVSAQFYEMAPFVFDDMLSEERANPQWTQTRLIAFNDLLKDSLLTGVELLGIRCYETLCKLEVSSDSKESLMELQRQMAKNDSLYGAAHFFSSHNGDGTYESSIYAGRPREDQKIFNVLVPRLYKRVTGKSPDAIVPTAAQIAAAKKQLSGK